MREQVSQVLAQVRAGSRETFAAAGVKRTRQRVEDLLAIAGLQIIWGIINGLAAARRDLDRVVRQLDARDLLYMKHVDVVRRLAAADGR